MRRVASTSSAELDVLSLPRRAYASFTRGEVSRFGRRALGDRRRLWTVRSVEPSGLHRLCVVSERALTLAATFARAEGELACAFAARRVGASPRFGAARSFCAAERSTRAQGLRRHQPWHQRGCWGPGSAATPLGAGHDGHAAEPSPAREERAAGHARGRCGPAALGAEAAIDAGARSRRPPIERSDAPAYCRPRSESRVGGQTPATDRF